MGIKYYIAYGSNLNIDQMERRCPTAIMFGKGEIKGYELMYKGSKSGAYLTIEKCPGSTVPVGVWQVTDEDIKALDRYEGFPTFYYKKQITITVQKFYPPTKEKIKAFVYIMREEREFALPSKYYIKTCQRGYADFDLNLETLDRALERTKEGMKNNETD